jgi:hypothetical protein
MTHGGVKVKDQEARALVTAVVAVTVAARDNRRPSALKGVGSGIPVPPEEEV